MSFEWAHVRLGDHCTKIGSGATPKGGKDSYLDSGSYSLIRSQNIYNDRFHWDGLAFISEDQAKKLDSVSVEDGDVLLNITGDSVARACLAPKNVLPARVNQHVAIIRPSKEIFDARFVRYFLVSPHEQELLLGLAGAGATRNALTKGMIENLEVPCPPHQEQVRIANTLSALDDRIALLRETNATLEAIAHAIFKSWFVDFDPVHAKAEGRMPEGMDEATAALFPDGFEESELGLIPRRWAVERLANIVDLITKGTTPTTLKRHFVDEGINFIKAESITDDGAFIPEKFAHIDEVTHELLRRSQLKTGDILISIAGTIGRIAVITSEFLPANTNQAIALIRPKSNGVPGGLISRFLKRKESQQQMSDRVVQAVQANLSLGTLSDMKLIVPCSDVSSKLYDTSFASIDAKKSTNIRQIHTLTELRDTLLPRLISGKLRLPEAEAVMDEVT